MAIGGGGGGGATYSVGGSSANPVVSVAAGGLHGAAVTQDGALWTWGDNSSGELGTGTTTSSTTPVEVP